MALIKSCLAGGGTPTIKSTYVLSGSGTKTFTCDIGDYIIINEIVGGGPFSPTDLGTVTGADNVSFYGPAGSEVEMSGIFKATSTTVTLAYSNPNTGSAVVFSV